MQSLLLLSSSFPSTINTHQIARNLLYDTQDTVLPRLWTAARTLRIADGPDEVHLTTVAKMEIARMSKL